MGRSESGKQYTVIAATTNAEKLNWLSSGIMNTRSQIESPIQIAGIRNRALLNGVEGGLYESDRALVKAEAITHETSSPSLGWDIGLDIPALGENNPGPYIHDTVKFGMGIDRDPTNREIFTFYQDRLLNLPPEQRKGTIKHAFALTTPEGVTFLTTLRIPVTYRPEEAQFDEDNNPLNSMMQLDGYDKVFSQLDEKELEAYYSRIAAPTDALINEAIALEQAIDTRRSMRMGDRVWVFSDPLFHLYTEADKNGADRLARSLSKYYDGHEEGWATKQYGVSEGSGEDENGHHTLRRNMLLFGDIGNPQAMCSLVEKRGGAVKFNTFATDEAIRGSGYGSRLLTEVDDMMEALGVRKIYATTASPAALHLFHKHGYQTEAVFPRHYSKEYDENIVGKIFRHQSDTTPVNAREGMFAEDPGLHNVVDIEFMNGKGNWEELADLIGVLANWHDDVGPDYARQTMKGADNGFGNINLKGKLVLGARMDDNTLGAALVATLKRGGPAKLYPSIGNAAGQIILIEAAIREAQHLGSHVAYTFSPVGDVQQDEFLLSMGFQKRGRLREPYKSGKDLYAWSKHIE